MVSRFWTLVDAFIHSFILILIISVVGWLAVAVVDGFSFLVNGFRSVSLDLEVLLFFCGGCVYSFLFIRLLRRVALLIDCN